MYTSISNKCNAWLLFQGMTLVGYVLKSIDQTTGFHSVPQHLHLYGAQTDISDMSENNCVFNDWKDLRASFICSHDKETVNVKYLKISL